MSHHLHRIFEVWDGNAEAMAADIGESGVTVRQWRNRDRIHSDHWPKIIAAAAKRGRTLRMEDFYPPELVSVLPGHDAEAMSVDIEPSGGNLAEVSGGDGEADSHRPFCPTSSGMAATDVAAAAQRPRPSSTSSEAEAA